MFNSFFFVFKTYAGTGKTLLARAVAHHTDCTFIRVSGAELVQKYIGEVFILLFGFFQIN